MFNFHTNQIEYEGYGQYLDSINTSEYPLVLDSPIAIRDKGISQIKLDVDCVCYIENGDFSLIQEEGIQLKKFVLDYDFGNSYISAISSSNELFLKIKAGTRRINNVVNHFEISVDEDSKPMFFMNCFYKQNDKFKASVIMIHGNMNLLFQCSITNLSENNIKNLNFTPKNTCV